MGIYLCNSNNGDYLITTQNQGTVFLSFHIFFDLVEIFFIWQNISVYKRRPHTFDSWVLILFYACMHLVFIRTILVLLGGVIICYPPSMYNFLQQYCFIFKRLGFFLLVIRIITLLDQFPDSRRSCITTNKIWGICISDCFLFSLIYTFTEIGIWSKRVFMQYLLTVDLFLIALFIHYVIRLRAELQDYWLTKSEPFQAKIFILIIGITFFIRVFHVIFILSYLLKYESVVRSFVSYAVYNVLYIILTELVPSVLMIMLIFHNVHKGVNKNESFASSEALSDD